MNLTGGNILSRVARPHGIMLSLVALAISPEAVHGFTLEVVDPDGNPVSGFRWLLEEDNTNQPVPGVSSADVQALDIHKSHAPVIAAGHSPGDSAVIDVPDDTRYFASVLPDAGHAMSGTAVAVGQGTAIAIVNPYPVPTAQITILVFLDNNAINLFPDVLTPNTGLEGGLEDFTVVISDMAGQQMMNAFGHMLDTTYVLDGNGEPVLDGDGRPVVDVMGDGIITTDANGEATVKYVPPGKYGVQIIPPAGQGWVQTTTIEGTKTIDAWVQEGEGPLLVEFVPALQHVFVGFVRPFNDLDQLVTDGETLGSISGRVVYDHVTPPPVLQGFFSGPVVEDAWVGLNDQASGRGVYFAACGPDGSFVIGGIPAGVYQLVTTDTHLDSIFGFNTVILPDIQGNMNLDLGDVLAFPWFGRLEGSVFYDTNMNGFRDPGEVGIPRQDVLLRFRDGTIYQVQPTDPMGNYSFPEVFPFFSWLVTEVDFLRFKDTGYTNVVDAGGEIPADMGWSMPSRGKLNPQPQAEINPNTGNNLSRTEVSGSPGETLLQAMMAFAGQTNVIDWGKINYGPGESGGIAGMVYYAVTRAEDDPAFAAAEEWEPGIPRVQIALYEDLDGDAVIDDLDGDGGPTLADRDNHPLGWFDGTGARGPEDVDRNDDGAFDPGDAIQIVHTDSWDDGPPTGCIQNLPVVDGEPARDCYENFGTWNQLRPGVFDGGFAIASHFPGGMANTDVEADGLPPGIYVCEAATPPGYETLKEEDKNVDYGDQYIPAQEAALPDFPPCPCVGDPHTVPDFLSLFGDIEAPFAGQDRLLCDRKWLVHSGEQNTGVEFFMFTAVPKAARAVGRINNDLAAEGRPDSPVFGEKQPPSWIPVSFQDYANNELARVYCDEFGSYNALLPSTYTVNIAAPSGVSPHMLTLVLNHPGPIPDPNNPGEMITDPYFDPNYSITQYTFNFEPGRTTYLDTPVIPVGAFVGFPNRVLDIEPPDGTPVLYSVTSDMGGPLVCSDGDTITITSLGPTDVANPDYDPQVPGSPILVTRDFGFGTIEGEVTVGGVPLTITNWTDSTIQAIVDTGAVSTGQLTVTRGDNGRSTTCPGITLHVNDCDSVIQVSGGAAYPNTPIQNAIDAADPGTLILVGPGNYDENPILYKNVKLQGAGAGSTIINGNTTQPQRVPDWHDKIEALVASGDLALVTNDSRFLRTMEAPAVFVLGKPDTFDSGSPGLIDGFTIRSSLVGGGIYVNAHGDYLTIANNRITNSQGTYGGGVVVGTPPAFAVVPDSSNDAISIHNNLIAKNGGVNGGGGITLFSGADGYTVSDNCIIGNFTRLAGGGVAHLGTSDGGTIARNVIAFNEVFYGGEVGGDGGGILLAGAGVNPGGAGMQGAGTGSISVVSNLIQGNLAGSGSGGGIGVNGVNGQDTVLAPAEWYELNIFNNMIVNNVAAFRGGGVSLQNAAKVNVIHNTIAHNDSTATAAEAFVPGNLLQSIPQGAGISSWPHNADLAAATGQEFCDPTLVSNAIWHNRSFYWDGTLNSFQGELVFNTPAYWDLQVVGGGTMFPEFCILSDPAGYVASNVAADPLFLADYFNHLVAIPLIEEGGNFITVRHTDLTLADGDYHVGPASPAIDEGMTGLAGAFPLLATDIDGDPRPLGPRPDIGADEVEALVPGVPGGGQAAGESFPDDACPDDPDKTEPGICGCGVPDEDSDGDGVADCNDRCPFTPEGAEVDGEGCTTGVPAGETAHMPVGDQPESGQPAQPTPQIENAEPAPAPGSKPEAGQPPEEPTDAGVNPAVPGCGLGAVETMSMMSLLGFFGLRIINRRRWA